MSPISSIQLTPLSSADQGKITQLYRYLELFSEGDPARNSLFVFAPASGPLAIGDNAPSEEQLLIIDPPDDISDRFKLGNRVAALFTSTASTRVIPQVETVPGGVAHLRIGDHFLDIYSQQQGAIIHLPPLGILCGGDYGSNSTVPRIAPGSDGSEELETLRLLARLAKQHRIALYIPRIGTETADKVVVMERLAGDVAYLHALRRVVMPLAQRGEKLEEFTELTESVMPRDRRTAVGWTTHRANISSLHQVAGQTGAQ